MIFAAEVHEQQLLWFKEFSQKPYCSSKQKAMQLAILRDRTATSDSAARH